jgi:DNA-binding IclR family transcriptional regulator
LLGQTNPLHATGLGKCLLLGCDPREVLGDLVAFTARTVTSLSALEAELDEARARGYAMEVEELALGRACVAAPIRDRDGAVVAAISVSGSLSALDLGNRRDELAQVVIEAADTVSTALGYTATALTT